MLLGLCDIGDIPGCLDNEWEFRTSASDAQGFMWSWDYNWSWQHARQVPIPSCYIFNVPIKICNISLIKIQGPCFLDMLLNFIHFTFLSFPQE